MIARTKIAAALSVALLTVASTAAAEVTLYDFTEATSSYVESILGGSFNATGGNQDQAGYNASIDLSYDRILSSPKRDLEIGSAAYGTISRGDSDGASSSSTYGVKGDVELSNYFRANSKGLYWYGNGEVGLSKGDESVSSKIGVGLGYGRVVNVTPMGKAIRLMEALREQGSLTSDPSKDTYVRVATVISLEDEYKSKYRSGTSYTQKWISDIEKILVASGHVSGSLGAGGAIEAHDVLINEYFFARRHGWKVQGGVGLVLSNAAGEGGEPTLDLITAEYHRPVNNKTQFSDKAGLSLQFGDDTGYSLSNEMTLTYEVSDKIDWENTWLLDYTKSSAGESFDKTTNALKSELIYELDNKLNLVMTATLSSTDDQDDLNNNDQADTALNITARYNLK